MGQIKKLGAKERKVKTRTLRTAGCGTQIRPGALSLRHPPTEVAAAKPLGVDKFAAFQPGQGFDGFAGFFLGEAQVMEVLEIEPKLRTGAKEMSEAQGRVARHGACAMQDLRDAIGGHTELSRELRGAHSVNSG